MKRYFLNTLLGVCILSVFSACRHIFDREQFGNCTDEVQNQKETGVDCGGPCMPCNSCNNGKTDGEETGVDCGGKCSPCTAPCDGLASGITYTLNSQSFNGYSTSQQLSGNGYFNATSIHFDFSGGGTTGLVAMDIEFINLSSPKTLLADGQSMVISTSQSGSYSKDVSVKVSYHGNFAYSYFGGALDAGQNVYFKRSGGNYQVIFCNAAASTDRFYFNGTVS
jgi:hypothetical protein